jgi:hypothetical protein
MELGPFNGFGVEFKRRGGFYNGQLLLSEKGANVLKILARCGAMSGSQIRILTEASKSTMKTLIEKGFIDIYESGKTPPVYTLGQGGAEIINASYRIWDTIGLLRTVAANQLWVNLFWPDAEWDPYREFPVLTKGSSRYLVAAPRLRIEEPVLASKVFNYEDRVIIVAASERQLRETILLDPLAPERVRYTWDVLLKDGVTFYRLNGSRLVLDSIFSSQNHTEKIPEKIFQKSIDSRMAI